MNRPPSIRPPGGAPRPPQASSAQFDELQRRMREMYGEFGARPNDGQAKVVEVVVEPWHKPTLKLIAPIGLGATAVTLALGTDSQIINAVILLACSIALFRYLSKTPVHIAARTLLALSLFIESAAETPTWWLAPMRSVDMAFYASLKDYAGVPGMSLPLFFFASVYFLFRARAQARKNKVLPPKWAVVLPLVVLGSVFALEAFGLARGGQLTASFFQILHLMTMPIVALGYLYAIRGPDDLSALGSVIITVAGARAVLVTLVYSFAAFKFRTEPGFFVTTHSDSTLFVVALSILGTWCMEHRKRKTIAKAAGMALLILVGMALNNRRLAFVNAGVIPVFIYFALKPSKIKRRVNRAAILLGLLGVVYLIIAAKMESDSVVFKPARLILSAISQSDTSSESRDVENFNLIYTLRQSPIVGQGFGHGYIEKYHLYDISDLFKLYLFIPHNGVLWIWEVGGVVGFTLLWFIYPVTMTFALRAYRIGRNAVERSAGLAAAATVVACVAQIWGDQGFNSYMTLVIFGVAYAVAVRVETASVQGT
jgi:hypothetical protein